MSPRIEYTPRSFSAASLRVIEHAVSIAEEYADQGYQLTLRQLYYQFVARDLMPNRQTEYKRLGSIVNDARLAGLFDWDMMEDRTRNVEGGDAYPTTPEQALRSLAAHHEVPLWPGQTTRAEVWVEKEALAGVIERSANRVRVPYFSCRGYVSQSELWGAARRLEEYIDSDDVERVVVLHLGDHDPSGIDMTRDIRDRLTLFLDGDGYDPDQVEVRRIALNIDQVRQYNPPPNPAKLTDSRIGGYTRRFGSSSWELDALDPATLDALISAELRSMIDPDLWRAHLSRQATERAQLSAVADRWAAIMAELKVPEVDGAED